MLFIPSKMLTLAVQVIKRMRLPSMALEMGMRNLTLTTTYEDFGRCDLVIEAIVENIGIKQKVFQDLEKHCRSDCILATNTSTIDIDVIASKTSKQAQGTNNLSVLSLNLLSKLHCTGQDLYNRFWFQTCFSAALSCFVFLAEASSNDR
jgi:hypothetical protein